MTSVRVLNPLSTEEGFLRRTLTLGLLRAVETNWSAGVADIRLFEVGTVFSARGPGERPAESLHVAGVISGSREPAHWTMKEGGSAVDLWDLKTLFEAAMALAIPGGRLQVDKTEFVATAADGREAGRARRLEVTLPAWAKPVYGFELRLDPAPGAPQGYRPLPVHPASKRDLALLMPPGVTAAHVEEALRRSVGRLLESAVVFDEYRGRELPAGRRSVGFRLTLRAPDRTLRDPEVDGLVTRALQSLEKELGIQLRAT
jgi:phenylalanyl-tRNA synthetase beta chain